MFPNFSEISQQISEWIDDGRRGCYEGWQAAQRGAHRIAEEIQENVVQPVLENPLSAAGAILAQPLFPVARGVRQVARLWAQNQGSLQRGLRSSGVGRPLTADLDQVRDAMATLGSGLDENSLASNTIRFGIRQLFTIPTHIYMGPNPFTTHTLYYRQPGKRIETFHRVRSVTFHRSVNRVNIQRLQSTQPVRP